MADNDVVDTSISDGATGNQPDVSKGSGQSITPAPTPQDFVSKKDLENVVKELRGLQSRQDKEKDATARFMDEIRQKMNSGLSLDEAEKAVHADTQARLKDDLLFKIAEKVGVDSFSQQASTGNASPVTVDKAKTLQRYGLSENDTDVVVALANQSYGSELELRLAAAEIALKRANKPQPDASASIAPQGSPAPKASVEADIKKYQTEMIAARGNKQLGQQIKEKYRKAGVPVDQVTFTV